MVRFIAGCVACLVVLGSVAWSGRQTPASVQRTVLYDANPNHVWNRVHQQFHVRTAPDGSQYGFDTVDPLLWRETRYLLEGPSHEDAVGVLDEFLSSNAEGLVRDPLKRAVFQNDLWSIFDWLVSGSEGDPAARNALMQRVARVIRRVALPRQDIEALPDTYAEALASGAFADRRAAAQPYLPRDLSSPSGPWVGVGGAQPLTPHHAAELGRSAFIVLWRVPGGQEATMDYLKKLWNFPQPFVADETFQFARDGEVRAKLNPALPPVPAGTEIALVRKMLLIDDRGIIGPSNLVQSIQLRAFPEPLFAEVRMSRAALFARTAGGLQAVGAGEREFMTFSAHGIDVFEFRDWSGMGRTSRVLDGCVNCHQVQFEPAVTTVLSLRHLLKPGGLVDPRHERWSRWLTQPIAAARERSRAYEWGVLQGVWQSQPR